MRKLLVAVVVLGLIAVGVDRLALSVVENRLADHIGNRMGTSDVEVDIAGFPFLTQVFQNHLDEVSVSLPSVEAESPVGSVQVEDIAVTLRDVESSNGFRKASAGSVEGSGLVPYAAFDQFAGIEVRYGGTTPNGVDYLEVSAPSLGPGSVRVTPSVVDGLNLDLGALSALGGSVPQHVRAFLGAGHGLTGLPEGLQVEEVDATADGLHVTLSGGGVVIAE